MVLPHLSKHLKHTRKALVTLRESGDVRGWFGLVQKGRPKTTIKSIVPTSNKTINDPITLNDNGAADTVATAPGTTATAAEDLPPPLCPRDRHGRTNWAIPGAFERLKAAVIAVDVRVAHQASLASTTTPISTEAEIILQEGMLHSIPRSTLTRQLGKFRDAAAEFGIPSLDELTVDDMFSAWRRRPLFDHDDIQFLSNTINYRDMANTGMSRVEVISLMMEMKQLGGSVNRIKC